METVKGFTTTAKTEVSKTIVSPVMTAPTISGAVSPVKGIAELSVPLLSAPNSGNTKGSWGDFNTNLSNTADAFSDIANDATDFADVITNPTITTVNTFDAGGTTKLLIIAIIGFVVGKMFKWW